MLIGPSCFSISCCQNARLAGFGLNMSRSCIQQTATAAVVAAAPAVTHRAHWGLHHGMGHRKHGGSGCHCASTLPVQEYIQMLNYQQC
jgi:hypothetical protein